jgi:hypothetical protein
VRSNRKSKEGSKGRKGRRRREEEGKGSFIKNECWRKRAVVVVREQQRCEASQKMAGWI